MTGLMRFKHNWCIDMTHGNEMSIHKGCSTTMEEHLYPFIIRTQLCEFPKIKNICYLNIS